MASPVRFYTDPAAIAPLKLEALPAELQELALEIVAAAARLSRSLHPVTARAIADFLRPANSCYSNLMEGHDTHLLAIAQALREEYAPDSRSRSLQQEALAHIGVHRELAQLLAAAGGNPTRRDFGGRCTERFTRSYRRNFAGWKAGRVPGWR